MIPKKIIVLGANSETVQRALEPLAQWTAQPSLLRTVGVRIGKLPVNVNFTSVLLMLWHVAPDERFKKQVDGYMRGSHALAVLADASDTDSVDRALRIFVAARDAFRSAPQRIFVLNANDAAMRACEVYDDGKLTRVVSIGADSTTDLARAFADLARDTLT